MYAHCDLNKFYASIIRVFMPELEGKPVIVLSNNDGCNICYSPGNLSVELPIEMGTPIFEIEHLVKRYGIHVFSCNFPLIADMSIRVKSILARFSCEYENYSIDEIFINFSGFSIEKIESICRELVRIIDVGLGLPISIGVGSTKTLAKLGTHYAKKHKGYEGVCIIDTEEKRKKALTLCSLHKIWGIGKKSDYKLQRLRAKNAYEFTQLPPKLVRKQLTVVGERKQLELKGIACIPMEIEEPPKKNIMVSRSFGKLLPDFETIAEALSTYAGMLGAKLRKQGSKAKSLYIFLETSPFRAKLPQLQREIVVQLPVPANSTMELIHYGKIGLREIYEQGYMFKITGIMAQDLCPDTSVQLNLYDPLSPEKRKKYDSLSITEDNIKNKFGRNAIYVGAQGDGIKWAINQNMLCPYYTTRESDLLVAY